MKNSVILKTIVVIVPVLVAVYAHYYEIKKQEKLEANTKELYVQRTAEQLSQVTDHAN